MLNYQVRSNDDISRMLTVRDICEAWGAKFEFRHVKQPVVIDLPHIPNPAYLSVVLSALSQELYDHLGVYSNIENGRISFMLDPRNS